MLNSIQTAKAKNVCSVTRPVRVLTFHDPDIFLHFNYDDALHLQDIDVYSKDCSKLITISADEYKKLLEFSFNREKIKMIQKLFTKKLNTLSRQSIMLIISLKIYTKYIRPVKK